MADSRGLVGNIGAVEDHHNHLKCVGNRRRSWLLFKLGWDRRFGVFRPSVLFCFVCHSCHSLIRHSKTKKRQAEGAVLEQWSCMSIGDLPVAISKDLPIEFKLFSDTRLKTGLVKLDAT